MKVVYLDLCVLYFTNLCIDLDKEVQEVIGGLQNLTLLGEEHAEGSHIRV